MTNIQLKEFCLLWGFDIEDDEHNCLPYSLLPKMLKDAKEKYGERFCIFMNRITDTTDGFTYIRDNVGNALPEACNDDDWTRLYRCWIQCESHS